MFRSFIFTCTAFLILPARPANPQTPSISGPVAGFVYDHGSRSVRPLLGIPGATYAAAPVLSGVDWASIAPGGKWAFVAQSGGAGFVQGLSSAVPVASSGASLMPAVDRVVWNRDGSFALLYSSSSGLLQRISLSDTAVSPDAPVDLSSWGRPAALAIDPSGSQIAFGVAGAGLYLFSPGQSPAPISSMSKPVAAAFDETGLRLYAADLDQQVIVTFDSGGGPAPFASLAQADGSVLNPVGLAVSAGNRYLLLADRAMHTVLVYETASQNLANTIPLDFAPSRLEALSAGPTFLLNGDKSNEWLMVLDARQIPTVYFVPASQQEPL
jgi:DNA-binding beta-propeller fold protein YncE